MKSIFLGLNEKLFSTREISSVGTVGTMRLLRGGAARFLNFIGRCLSYTTTRAYGCFLMSFGFLSLLLHLGEYYFKSSPEVPLHTLLLCALVVIIAIPLLIFSKPICIAAQDFAITDRLFFEFLSIKRMHKNIEHKSIPPLLAVFLGFIPAALGYILSVEWVLLGMFILVLAFIAFTSPEFSMILSVVLLPYLPLFENSTLLLCSLSLITFISYAMKVVIGKRSFSFDVYTVIAAAVILVALIGGISGYGGTTLKNSLVAVSLVMAYFPISNIVINRRLADSVINAVAVSAAPITVISIIEFVVEHPKTSFAVPKYSTPGISAFFTSPSALAAFFLVSSILTLVCVVERKGLVGKGIFTLIFFLQIAVLGLVMQPGALIAVFFAMLAYAVIRSRKIPIAVLLLLVVIPHFFFLLPSDFLDTLYDSAGLYPIFSDRLLEYGEGFSLLKENIWFGIDFKTGSMADYNALLGVGLELGVIALALLAFALIIRLGHLSYFRLYVRNSGIASVADMTAVALIALFVYGAFENVFADITVAYIFFLVFALSTASLRTAKRENDDLLGYYGDSRSSDSSALDVSVNRQG